MFYTWSEESDEFVIVPQPGMGIALQKDEGFSRVKNLVYFLDLSIGTLATADDGALVAVGDENVPANQIVQEQRAIRTSLFQYLSNTPEIIKAIDHFNKLLISTKPEGD